MKFFISQNERKNVISSEEQKKIKKKEEKNLQSEKIIKQRKKDTIMSYLGLIFICVLAFLARGMFKEKS